MDPTCTQNPWAITAVTVLLCTAVQQFFLFFRVHAVLLCTAVTAVVPFSSSTHVSEGSRPTQGLIVVSRVRTRGMARLFDLGQGSSVNDSARLVSSLDADESQFCSAAMTAEVRIG